MNATQKLLVIGLVLVGLGVWSYNSLLLFGRLGLAEHTAAPWDQRPGQSGFELPVPGRARTETARTPFVGAFRDPFEPVLRLAPASGPAQQRSTPSASVAPPPLALEGILWDQTDPIAIIKGPDGRSEPLRVGMTLAGATVLRIEPAAVRLRFGKQTLTLRQNEQLSLTSIKSDK